MRAATSVSLTIGVALATLVVVGGILAGPAILDCTHQSGGIGACLRGKVVQSGLLPAPPSSSELPVSIESSSSAAVPIIAELPRRSGWIEANATEYEAPPPGVAALSQMPGAIAGQGAVAKGNGAEAAASVAAPAGSMTVTGRAPATKAAAEVALVEPAGRLIASGTAAVLSDPLSATLAPSVGTPTVSGSLGVNTAPSAAATLEAELSPPSQAVPEPMVAPPPALPAPKILRKPSLPKAAAIAPAKPQPQRVLKFNPRYPNVLVLPPPNTGANSSFATLELHR